eukprot:COSAG02_NODE_2932_length_7712_cov_2.172468_5_plen_60_part_00
MLHRIAFNFDKCQGAVPIAGLYAPSDADRRLGAALRGSCLELAWAGSIGSLGWGWGSLG